jgi:hypothetical protein
VPLDDVLKVIRKFCGAEEKASRRGEKGEAKLGNYEYALLHKADAECAAAWREMLCGHLTRKFGGDE